MRKIIRTLIYCSLSSRKQSEERFFLQFCDVAEVISVDDLVRFGYIIKNQNPYIYLATYLS
jgi:hypothetical protein